MWNSIIVEQSNGNDGFQMLAVKCHENGDCWSLQALLLSDELKLNELLCVDFLIIAAEEVRVIIWAYVPVRHEQQVSGAMYFQC